MFASALLRSVRLRLGCGALLILALAQLFNGGLSLASLEKFYVQSLLSRYEVSGQDVARKIQRAVRLGKPLALFAGAEELMRAAKDHLPDLDDILVTAPDGRILHSLRPSAPDDRFLPPVEASGEGGLKAFRRDGSWRAPFRIEGRRNEFAGVVYLSFRESVVDAKVKEALVENLRILGLSTAGALAFLVLALGAPGSRATDGARGRRALWIILITALVGAQSVYGYCNARAFAEACRDFAIGNAETSAGLLRQDVSYLLGKGVRLERLRNLEPHLDRIIHASPDVSAIAVLGPDGTVLHKAVKGGEPFDPSNVDVRLPLAGPDGEVDGFVAARLDRQAVADRVFDITLDSVTVGVIALLFLVEMMMLLAFSVKRSQAAEPADRDRPAGSGAGLAIRPLAFLLVFAMDMVASFIPLRMEALPSGLGLSKEMLMGLPVSAEFLFAGVALTVAGFRLAGRSARPSLFAGVLVIAAGYVYSGAASDALGFLLARALTGLGYGLTIMSAQSYVVASAPPEARAAGIANLFAGVYAGTLCGAAAGAMLAERIGYARVFYVSAAILLLVAVGALLLPRERVVPRQSRREGGNVALADLKRLLSDRDMVLLMALSILPGGMLMTGFLNYLAPVVMSRAGASQSDIGRAFMAYSLCLAYLAPFIAKAADRSSHKKRYLFAGGVIASGGLLGFALVPGVAGATVFAFMLGLAGSVGLAAQNAFALSLPVAREAGESRTMGVYNLSERLGQVLGPVALAWAASSAGATQGALGLSVVFLASSFLLLWLCRGKDVGGSEEAVAPVRS